MSKYECKPILFILYIMAHVFMSVSFHTIYTIKTILYISGPKVVVYKPHPLTVSMHRYIFAYNTYNLFSLTIHYSKNFTTNKVLTI